MVQAERMQAILKQLKENGFLTVEFLVNKLHYSPATIRRDLTELAGLGLIEKNWGGVSLLSEDVHGSAPYPFRLQKNAKDKQKVARLAATLVKDGDILFIDGSTTASYMLPYLLQKKDITVITNNLGLVTSLHRGGIHAICTGGTLSRDGDVFYGYEAERAIEERRADKCFFSAHGLERNGCITDHSEDSTRLVRKMLQNARECIFLCDKSKLDAPAPILLTTMDALSHVVCESDISKALTRSFPGVTSVSAPPKGEDFSKTAPQACD